VINRRLAHQSGLFYEDETEVTGITEDLYYRKKPSLLHVDAKSESAAEKASLVDGIPQPLLELVQQQSAHNLTAHNSIVKYSKLYLKSSPHPSASMSMIELMDSNEVVSGALEQVKSAACSDAAAKLDEALKGSCVHKWTLLQAPGPHCSEDIVRVMKALQPVLNDAVHVKKSAAGSKDTSVLSVQGPLTWRQFHQMAGPSTKGNTDDQCEPLPVPAVTVGHEKDFMSLSPLALHYWDSLSIEPFSQPRDIAYLVVTPENEILVEHAKRFFRNLSVTYEVRRQRKTLVWLNSLKKTV
jgi:mediator of RNA polymerase II transcription subunit 13